MKIIVTCQVLNEERNIAQFCENYDFADKILITDGGSDDRTVEIAESYDNVEVIDVSYLRTRAPRPQGAVIDQMPDVPDDFYITPEPHQTNMLIYWAKILEADWIIKDEADCWPNPKLKAEARAIIESTAEDMILAYRLYIWGQDQYFPKINQAGQSLWAWRPDRVTLKADESNPFSSGFMGRLPDQSRRFLDIPYVLLHYFCPDEQTVHEKMIKKAAKGVPWVHPLKSIYAPPEPLPAWAKE